jgi:UDP-glucose 4-epimerase
MKILVTGGQGGIGRSVVKKLIDNGHTIRSFDRAARSNEFTWEHIPGDIRDITQVRKLVDGIDVVIHMAAILTDTPTDQELIYSVNIQGTWNILMACMEAGVSRLINFSSIQALGHSNSAHTAIYFPIDDQVPRQPASPYQISKHVGEEMCQAFTVQSDGSFHHEMTIISLRPTFCFTARHHSKPLVEEAS